MKFSNTSVMNFDGSFRGLRNPKNSWARSDSKFNVYYDIVRGGVTASELLKIHPSAYIHHKTPEGYFADIIGDNDMKLAQKLIRADSEHRKFLRQIFVSVDITAPLYYMSELDTYKIGVSRNSTSFMHKGMSKAFEIEDFEVGEEIAEILTCKKSERKPCTITYPYETDEYRIYENKNGRKYEVYKNGRIFSAPFSYTDTLGRNRFFERREIKPSLTKGGYWELNIGGRQKEKWLLHRLIAYVWLENPHYYETVDHINCNKNDNSAENLEWVTREENIRRQYDNGLMRSGNMHANYMNWKKSSKIDLLKKREIIEMRGRGMSQSDIALCNNFSQSQVSVVCRGEKNSSENSDLFEQCLAWEVLLSELNNLRDKFLTTKDSSYFEQIRKLLPSSYLYKSTITMNYENIFNMVRQRKNHKLNEWSGKDNPDCPNFIAWARTLPYAQELIFLDETEEN